MSNGLHFLPPEINLNCSETEKINRLYPIFRADFINRYLDCDGRRVLFDNSPGDQNLENGFWHLVRGSQGTLIDVRRASKLCWIRPMIENHKVPDILDWHYLEGNGDIKRYIWLAHNDYIVILVLSRDKRRYYIVTAFYVEPWKTRGLYRRYQNRITTPV
jgi:hypothetical protein